MDKYNKKKIIFFILVVSCYNLSFANYESRVKQVDQFIDQKMKNVKSTEKLDIPEYKGDTLTFERLSKIRNVFNINHLLPFEKIVPQKQEKTIKKVVKLKAIITPPELQKIMNTKTTKLQQYPLDSFKFKGTVYQNNEKWGIVENSMESKPIYLKIGEFVGQDYGQVSDVTKQGVIVTQWNKNTQKRVWEKIQATIH